MQVAEGSSERCCSRNIPGAVLSGIVWGTDSDVEEKTDLGQGVNEISKEMMHFYKE